MTMQFFCSIEPFPFDFLPARLRLAMGTEKQDCNELGSLQDEIVVAERKMTGKVDIAVFGICTHL